MNVKDNAILLMNEYGIKKIPFLFIIDFEMKEPIVLELNKIDSAILLVKTDNFKNCENNRLPTKNISFKKFPVGIDEYKKALDKVMQNISAGNTYLLNLTFPTLVKTNYTLEDIFYAGSAKYKLLYKNQFVVFSPETFIKIENGMIYSFPMKGTINADLKNAEEIILNDEKETAEHITIVDLIRNDLGIVSKNVVVEKFRYVEEVRTNDKNLLQVSSRISGVLPQNFNEILGEIVFKLLPAGSISGAPKKKTIEIIKEVETYPRNYYTGIFGIFDGNNLDSAVMIRFIENINGTLYYKSGGGITFLSKLESEYQEFIDKVYVPIN
jgi:para-aminobenzoate synthetase component I